MLSISVLGLLGSAGLDVSRRSVTLSAVPVIVVDTEHGQIMDTLRTAETDAVHLLPPSFLVLPGFYDALLTTMAHCGVDYVFCPCASQADKPRILRPETSEISPGQIVVRRWVYLEAGEGKSVTEALRAVVSEYRGAEVPQCMCVAL